MEMAAGDLLHRLHRDWVGYLLEGPRARVAFFWPLAVPYRPPLFHDHRIIYWCWAGPQSGLPSSGGRALRFSEKFVRSMPSYSRVSEILSWYSPWPTGQ